MLQIENAFFDLAEESNRNCLVICDRGAMDASAFISKDQWEHILAKNSLDEVEIRDNKLLVDDRPIPTDRGESG